MKKVLLSFFLGSSLVLTTACGDSEFVKKATEQAELALADEEYEKAINSYELALEEKSDPEIEKKVHVLKQWIMGRDLLQAGEITKAREEVNKWEEYEEYSFAKKMDETKKELQQQEETLHTFQTILEQLEKEVTDPPITTYRTAVKEADQLANVKEVKQVREEIEALINPYLEEKEKKLEQQKQQEEAAKKKAEEEKKKQAAAKQSLSGEPAVAQDVLHSYLGGNIRTQRLPSYDFYLIEDITPYYYAFQVYRLDTGQYIGIYYARPVAGEVLSEEEMSQVS